MTQIRIFPVRIRAVGRKVPLGAKIRAASVPTAHPDAMQSCRDRSSVLCCFAHEHEEVAVDIFSWKKFVVVQLCRKTGMGTGRGRGRYTKKRKRLSVNGASHSSILSVDGSFLGDVNVDGESYLEVQDVGDFSLAQLLP
ncbi:hypothetical protein C8R45DRAFT_943509 [Mycena sanguinolenta]|nr:hypothetical protein C8R45DRAFT_943509 [Mycena sanguinolenta]